MVIDPITGNLTYFSITWSILAGKKVRLVQFLAKISEIKKKPKFPRNMKRRRTGSRGGRASFVSISTVRPIDKKIVTVNKLVVGSAQQATTLISATFPCTITGLRWSVAAENLVGTNGVNVGWAIVQSKENLNVNNVTVPGDGVDFYTPEQEVLAWGVSKLNAENASNGKSIALWDGSTKTMRKLQNGDALVMIVRTDTAVSVNFTGVVQFFCKS